MAGWVENSFKLSALSITGLTASCGCYGCPVSPGRILWHIPGLGKDQNSKFWSMVSTKYVSLYHHHKTENLLSWTIVSGGDCLSIYNAISSNLRHWLKTHHPSTHCFFSFTDRPLSRPPHTKETHLQDVPFFSILTAK